MCECSAERWLQPGTEYADLGMLQLPADWYEALGINAQAANMSGADMEGAVRRMLCWKATKKRAV